MLLATSEAEDLSKPVPHLKSAVIESVNELLDELDTRYEVRSANECVCACAKLSVPDSAL